MLLLVVFVIFLSSILSSLLIVNLSEPRCIILAPNLLFYCVKFLVTGHIRPSPDISDLRSDIFTPPLGNFQVEAASWLDP
jgi:hypothetical protein